MTFVPYVPPPPTSPRAYELGVRLEETIESFRRDQPGTTDSEVKQAIGLVRQRAGANNPGVVGGVAAMLVLLGVFALFAAGRRAGMPIPWSVVAVIAGAGVLLAALAAKLRNR
jgi:hypothetical protein